MEKYQILMDGALEPTKGPTEVDATETTALYTSLTCATRPRFTIQGKNCLGVWSGESSALYVPIASLPAKVLNLAGSPLTASSIHYTWDKLVGEANVGSKVGCQGFFDSVRMV